MVISPEQLLLTGLRLELPGLPKGAHGEEDPGLSLATVCVSMREASIDGPAPRTRHRTHDHTETACTARLAVGGVELQLLGLGWAQFPT